MTSTKSGAKLFFNRAAIPHHSKFYSKTERYNFVVLTDWWGRLVLWISLLTWVVAMSTGVGDLVCEQGCYFWDIHKIPSLHVKWKSRKSLKIPGLHAKWKCRKSPKSLTCMQMKIPQNPQNPWLACKNFELHANEQNPENPQNPWSFLKIPPLLLENRAVYVEQLTILYMLKQLCSKKRILL